MACPSFEDLLRGGDHAAHCERCRALLDAVAEVDSALESDLRGISAPPGLIARARAQASRNAPLRRPTLLPEILDFIGWAAVLTVAAVLIPSFLPAIRTILARLG